MNNHVPRIGLCLNRLDLQIFAKDEVARDAKVEPFLFRLTDKFFLLYTIFSLWRGKRELVFLLNSAPHHIDPMVLLRSGVLLIKLREFDHAHKVFMRILSRHEELMKNRHLCIKARMGALECLIVKSIKNGTCCKNNHDHPTDAQYLFELISKELTLVDDAIQDEIRKRLAGVKALI